MLLEKGSAQSLAEFNLGRGDGSIRRLSSAPAAPSPPAPGPWRPTGGCEGPRQGHLGRPRPRRGFPSPPGRRGGRAGEKKGPKLYPCGLGSAEQTARFLHRQNPRRIFLKFSFRSYG